MRCFGAERFGDRRGTGKQPVLPFSRNGAAASRGLSTAALDRSSGIADPHHMKLLQRLLGRGSHVETETTLFERALSTGETFGQATATVTEGANLVDGKQTWELAPVAKDDVEAMKRCCDAEEATFRKTGLAAAPYYFERVAILSRKRKDFRQEIEYCTRYVDLVEQYYRQSGAPLDRGVRMGPTYKAIVARLPKAKELLAKQRG